MADPRTSLYRWKGSIILLAILLNTPADLYTMLGRNGQFLFDQSSEKDHRKAAVSGQPKAIVDGEDDYAE